MTTADKPSVAELQRIEDDPTADFEGVAIRSAAPVLLEIAAAALAWNAAPAATPEDDYAYQRFQEALAKVRP